MPALDFNSPPPHQLQSNQHTSILHFFTTSTLRLSSWKQTTFHRNTSTPILTSHPHQTCHLLLLVRPISTDIPVAAGPSSAGTGGTSPTSPGGTGGSNTGAVDYLSFAFNEFDLHQCWKNATRQKDSIINGRRLENASWRRFFQMKFGLQTINPATLNWQKTLTCVGYTAPSTLTTPSPSFKPHIKLATSQHAMAKAPNAPPPPPRPQLAPPSPLNPPSRNIARVTSPMTFSRTSESFTFGINGPLQILIY
ncbi:hypothetical protein BC829DRAFT_179752 [Chytridium lagenaria]|nr:hypothetical protein BC829DRAFT_179752 [Chytridium lagenaria]